MLTSEGQKLSMLLTKTDSNPIDLLRMILLLGIALPFTLSACRPLRERSALPPETQAVRSIATMDPPATKSPPIPTPAQSHTPTASQLAPQISLSVGSVDQLQFLRTLERHQSSITDLSFSPDSQYLASSSSDGSILIWDIHHGSVLTILDGHAKAVHSLDFSPDGYSLASGSDDGTVKIWEVASGDLNNTIDSPLLGRILKVAFSPDGLLLAMADHQCLVELRRTSSGLLHRTYPHSNCNVRTSGSVAHFELEFASAGQEILVGEGRPCCNAGSILAWDVYQPNPPHLIKGFNFVVRDFDLAPYEEIIAVALIGSPDIRILEASDGSELDLLQAHTWRVNSLQFTPEGSLLLSGSRDKTAILWSLAEGTPIRVLEGHTDAINVVRISPDGRWVVTASNDQTIRVYGFTE
jgi:WD40 repeat protein